MRSVARGPDDAGVWDVVRPPRTSRIPGVSMAGFCDRGTSAVGHRAIPHPAVTLALDFGAGPLVVDDAAGRQHRGSLVAGLGLGFGSGAVRVRGKDFEAVQVRLSPLLARAVLGCAPSELDGAVIALDDLWGRRAARIRERLSAASSWEDRFALTDALLADRCQADPAGGRSSIDPEVAWVWRRIVGSRGQILIDRLAAEVGWSRKRLWSRFHAQIGLAPKRAATLVRFDHAVHRLVAHEGVAAVAADTGYADQSHLHRDVVAYTGMTPATVVNEPWLAVDDLAWPDPRVSNQATGAAPSARSH